jgi:hypothetical protein
VLTAVGPLGLFFKVGPSSQCVQKHQGDNTWSCSCTYFALHQRTCSHIMAAKYWLKGDDLEDEQHEHDADAAQTMS